MQNFEKIIRVLLDNEVDFVLIGGFAAAVYGVTLITQDIDICVSFDKQNSGRILKAVKGLNPSHRDGNRPLNETVESLTKFKNLYLSTDFGPIDLLGHVSGLGSYSDLKNHFIEVELFGKKCKVLDIDALISSKREMGRPKDKETIIQLEAIKEKLAK